MSNTRVDYNTPAEEADGRSSFYELAKKWNTDKVNPHQYQFLYEKYPFYSYSYSFVYYL